MKGRKMLWRSPALTFVLGPGRAHEVTVLGEPVGSGADASVEVQLDRSAYGPEVDRDWVGHAAVAHLLPLERR